MKESELPAVIQSFVDRMANDLIIGFRFDGKDLERIKLHELELARKHLFGTGRYSGRPIGPLHRAQKINAGQFRRRLAVLRTVLQERGVDPALVKRWIEHDAALESVITDGTDCVP